MLNRRQRLVTASSYALVCLAAAPIVAASLGVEVVPRDSVLRGPGAYQLPEIAATRPVPARPQRPAPEAASETPNAFVTWTPVPAAPAPPSPVPGPPETPSAPVAAPVPAPPPPAPVPGQEQAPAPALPEPDPGPASEPAPDPEPVPVIETLPEPRVRPNPIYPTASWSAGREGVVHLHVWVSEIGAPEVVKVMGGSGDEALDQAAVAAVQRWAFKPGTRDGRAVGAAVPVEIRFRIRR